MPSAARPVSNSTSSAPVFTSVGREEELRLVGGDEVRGRERRQNPRAWRSVPKISCGLSHGAGAGQQGRHLEAAQLEAVDRARSPRPASRPRRRAGQRQRARRQGAGRHRRTGPGGGKGRAVMVSSFGCRCRKGRRESRRTSGHMRVSWRAACTALCSRLCGSFPPGVDRGDVVVGPAEVMRQFVDHAHGSPARRATHRRVRPIHPGSGGGTARSHRVRAAGPITDFSVSGMPS